MPKRAARDRQFRVGTRYRVTVHRPRDGLWSYTGVCVQEGSAQVVLKAVEEVPGADRVRLDRSLITEVEVVSE